MQLSRTNRRKITNTKIHQSTQAVLPKRGTATRNKPNSRSRPINLRNQRSLPLSATLRRKMLRLQASQGHTSQYNTLPHNSLQHLPTNMITSPRMTRLTQKSDSIRYARNLLSKNRQIPNIRLPRISIIRPRSTREPVRTIR